MIKEIAIKKNIKPCPFCGGIAKSYIKMTKTFMVIHNYYVACTECGAATNQYDTEFSTQINGKMRVLTEKEAIKKAVNDWNNHKFNTKTRLAHMSYKDMLLWWTERLLSIAWYGLASNDSPEFIAGWELREIAENRELIKLHSEINYDLSEDSKVLFNDFHVKDIVYQYLQNRGSMLL